MTSYSEILYEVEDPVATITFNRPDRLNAVTETLDRELKDAIQDAVADARVVGILITGAGRGFCSGAEMGLLADNAASGGDLAEKVEFPMTYSFLNRLPKPVIAVVNGACAGMGMAIAACSDLRFASDTASFTSVFAQRGLIAEMGLSWTLPRLVGVGRALDILMSSRRIDAAEALRMGLVDQVHPPAEVLEKAKAYVRDLAATTSPASLAVIKAQVYADLEGGLIAAEEKAIAQMMASFRRPDLNEGVNAYMEKRPANFPRLTGEVADAD